MSEASPGKGRLKIIVMAPAVLAALVVLVTAGLVVFLRSAPGEKFVFNRAASVLAANGFELSADEFSGPLPGRLYVRGLKFSDKDGPVATVGEAELRLDWPGLLDGLVHLSRLELKSPQLWRLPELEKAEEEEPGAALALPLALQLDELSVTGGLVHGGVTGSEGPPLALAVAGTGRIQAGPVDRAALSAGLTLEIADLAALAPELSGPLTVEVNGSGALTDLKAAAALAGPQLSAPDGLWKNIDLKLNLGGALMAAGQTVKPDLDGEVKLTASSPGGPLNLNLGWRLQTGGGLLAEIRNLRGSVGALNFAGGLRADLRGEKPALDGSFTAETADWIRLAALIGQPLSGEPARLTVKLAAENTGQSAQADLDLPALSLAGASGRAFALHKARAAVRAADLFGRADLEADLSLGPGLAGSAKWSGAELKAGGRAGGGNFSLDLNGLEFSGFGGSAGDGLHLAGAYDLNEKIVDLTRLDLSMAASALKLNSPARLNFGDGLRLSPASLAVSPAGSLEAELDLRPGRVAVKAKLASLPFSFFKPLVGPAAAMPEGSLESLDLNLNQGPGGIDGTAFLAAAVRYRGLASALNLRADLSGGAKPGLEVTGRIEGGPGWEAGGDLKGSLPFKAGPGGSFPELDLDAPLSASLDWSGPVEPVWQLAGQPDRLLRGVAAIQAEVGGSLARPEPRGSLYVAGGRYEDSVLGLLVSDISLEAHSAPDALLTARLAAKDGLGGGLALEAGLKESAKGLEVDASGRLGRFNPLRRDDVDLYLSGDIAVRGPLERPLVTSDLNVDRGELDLKVLLAAQSVPTLTIAEGGETTSSSRGPRLDMKVNVPNQFFIRGYGLDSEWRGRLQVGGFPARPSLSGSLAPVRGVFEIFSREFQFRGGDISWGGGVDPTLNLELQNSGPNITALIKIGGRGTAPSLRMTSQPPQPEEEVLAQVLFGKQASSLSRFEALQLAAGLRALTGFGPGFFSFDPLGGARQKLGLDVLRIGGGAGGGSERSVSDLSGSLARDVSGAGAAGGGAAVGETTLEAGKYISDKVYVGVEQSVSGGSAFRVEMELSPLTSLEARTSSESSQIGVGWKKDY